MRRPSTDGSLWAITCYFNPIGYKRRLINYHTFRQRLKVPLVTVELSFDDKFELEPNDADILIQLRGRDILWQKERLLNVALQSLPEDCDQVAWLDCDIVFQDDDWSWRARQGLNEFAIIQLFADLYDVASDEWLNTVQPAHRDCTATSMIHKLAVGETVPEDLGRIGRTRLGVGNAWAGRREVLDLHGFYDACILGSGDWAMLCATLGKFQYGAQALKMSGSRVEHYLAWAKPFFSTVRSSVSYMDEVIYHLWHGDLEHRNWAGRHEEFKKFNFDPYTDIAIDEAGCWRWNTNKKEMHEYVKSYFESRKEDGS